MIPKTELCELAVKYGSDKAPQLRSYPVTADMALPSHCYTPTYHDLFYKRQIKRLVEIGIYEGASLRMWRDYFPEADIIGLDKEVKFLINDERIRSYYCDQSDEESLIEAMDLIGGKVDLFVDDGSHNPYHQILTVETFIPFLNADGYYIIEDVGRPEIVVPELKYRGFKFEVREFHENESKHNDDRIIILRRR